MPALAHLGGTAHDAVGGVPVLLREGRQLLGGLQEQAGALLGPASAPEDTRHLLQAGAVLDGDLDKNTRLMSMHTTS